MCAIAVGVVAVACAQDDPPSSAMPPLASHSSPGSAPTPIAVDSTTASDGLVSAQEAARASELARSNEIISDLLDQYAGQLTRWEPAELEGEPRGAVAMIEFSGPISIVPTVLRPKREPPPTGVEDYELELVRLPRQPIDNYGVIVDLKTMTIVHLAPTAAPPRTVATALGLIAEPPTA